MQKLIFTKFNGKVAHGPWKKRLDFGGNNLDHSMLGLWLGGEQVILFVTVTFAGLCLHILILDRGSLD